MKNKRRITFSEDDAAEIYELALQNFQDDCWKCKKTKKKLEKFLGEKHVKRIRKVTKANPYDEHDMSWHGNLLE